MRKTGSTTNATILYIGSLLEQETAGGTTTWKHYVSARGRTVAQVNRVGSTNTVQYLHRDHQGSVVEVTNSSGTLVQSLAYDAWGLRRNPTTWAALASPFAGTQPTKRGYTGHEHLDNVELVHMNGRVQDPKLGVFISADPTVPEPFNTQSFDRYAYVFNNPASLVDPSGFEPIPGQPSTPGWDWPVWSPPMVVCCIQLDPDTGAPMTPRGDASWNPGVFSAQTGFVSGEGGFYCTGYGCYSTDPIENARLQRIQVETG